MVPTDYHDIPGPESLPELRLRETISYYSHSTLYMYAQVMESMLINHVYQKTKLIL